MIATQGGRFGGYGFYLLKGKPVFLYNLVDLIRQPVIQIRQRTDDTVISPAGVLARHPDHQGFDLGGNRRTARILPVFGAVELLGHQRFYRDVKEPCIR
jgi:hypothetical protein